LPGKSVNWSNLERKEVKRMPKTPPPDKRVIAIQVTPKAYDEIQRLKGELTWARFTIECVLARVGDNSILQDELANLPKPKEPKPPKPKAEKKGKKAGKAEAPGKQEPIGTENKGGG
jgi:hypothetical protein